MSIEIKNLRKSFDDFVLFENFNITIPSNKITCILGPSGCGKTTLLNIIGKLVEPEQVEFQGIDSKTISYIFQETRLLKWRTVKDNIDFVLKDKMPIKEREEQIRKYLDTVELTEFADYYPDKLSGGMAQRLSIARAFAYSSDILLMDEPFKELDIKLKMSLMDAFIKLWEEDKRTVIFVTHDIDEATYLADRIFVLGSPPTTIKKQFINELPRGERALKHDQMYSMQKAISELMLE